MEPVHYNEGDMTAIDVKDLLKAAPIRAPTRQELTASVIASSQVCCIVLVRMMMAIECDGRKRTTSERIKEGTKARREYRRKEEKKALLVIFPPSNVLGRFMHGTV